MSRLGSLIARVTKTNGKGRQIHVELDSQYSFITFLPHQHIVTQGREPCFGNSANPSRRTVVFRSLPASKVPREKIQNPSTFSLAGFPPEYSRTYKKLPFTMIPLQRNPSSLPLTTFHYETEGESWGGNPTVFFSSKYNISPVLLCQKWHLRKCKRGTRAGDCQDNHG